MKGREEGARAKDASQVPIARKHLAIVPLRPKACVHATIYHQIHPRTRKKEKKLKIKGVKDFFFLPNTNHGVDSK